MSSKEYRIRELASLKYGKMVPDDIKSEQGYPVFSGYGITGSAKEYLYKEEKLVVVARGVGGTGDVKISPPESWITNLSIVLDVNEQIVDKNYLKHYLNLENLKDKLNTGSAQSQITIGSLEPYKVSLPGIAYQKKVAGIIKEFDNLIENNTRRIEILEEMARRIYREWFVHFRYPGHEEDELVDSDTELGEIPEGWEVKQLKEVIELTYGIGLRKKDRVNGKYPVYGSSGIIDWHNDYHVEGPGVIVGRKGNVGSMFWEYENFNPIDTTYYVETDLPLTYTFFNLQNQNFINSDAAVPGLSKRQASTLPVLVPDRVTLDNFDTKILQLFDLNRVLEEKNETLKETRDLLLPKLISGKIDVEEITFN